VYTVFVASEGNQIRRLRIADANILVIYSTSVLFRLLVPRKVKIKHMRHLKNDLEQTSN